MDVASKIHGEDMNGDGEGDFGSCIFKKRNAQSYFAIQTFAAPIVQTQGTAQGFHFDNSNMKPIVNNEGWKKAFELYKATGKYGPPDELNMDIGDTRALFKAGRCGLIVEWGDPGTLQLDDDAKAIRGKMYAISAVGSTEVLDRATGKLVPVSAATAPYAVDGINYAPFAAFGGWAGAVNKDSLDILMDTLVDGKLMGSYDISAIGDFIDSYEDIFTVNPLYMIPILPIDPIAAEENQFRAFLNMPASAYYLRVKGSYSFNNILIEYRQIGPGYRSFGNPYLTNNIREFTINDRLSTLGGV